MSFRLADRIADVGAPVGVVEEMRSDHLDHKRVSGNFRRELADRALLIERFETNLAARWLSGNAGLWRALPVRLPFQSLWAEYWSFSDPGKPFPSQGSVSMGCYFMEQAVEPGGRLGEIEEAYYPESQVAPLGATYVILCQPGFMNRDNAFIVAMDVYVFVDDLGRLVGSSTASGRLHDDQVRYYYHSMVQPNLLGVCLANVKGARVSEPRAQVTHRQRKERRSSTQRLTYRVITVPGTPASGRYLRVDGGGQLPLHLVRGHLATYTDEAPLFGKHTGTYWRPAHARGNPEKGISTKDYRVKPRDGAPDGT